MDKITADNLIKYCQENKRVCPNPQKWNELWEILPEKKTKGIGWEPSIPLILAAWHDTPAFLKMMRLAEHIQWAEKHNALPDVAAFIHNLKEGDWFHVGE